MSVQADDRGCPRQARGETPHESIAYLRMISRKYKASVNYPLAGRQFRLYGKSAEMAVTSLSSLRLSRLFERSGKPSSLEYNGWFVVVVAQFRVARG